MGAVKQVPERPTAAVILSLVGGAVGLALGFLEIAIGWSGYEYFGRYRREFELLPRLFGVTRESVWIYLVVGVWGVVAGAIVVVCALALRHNPLKNQKWGALIVAFSILGLNSLLAFIGGILALMWKPDRAGKVSPSVEREKAAEAVRRICPRCGRVLSDMELKFCPYCGKDLTQG